MLPAPSQRLTLESELALFAQPPKKIKLTAIAIPLRAVESPTQSQKCRQWVPRARKRGCQALLDLLFASLSFFPTSSEISLNPELFKANTEPDPQSAQGRRADISNDNSHLRK